MNYILSKRFEKQFGKLSSRIKNKTIRKIEIFCVNPFDKSLNNHLLNGRNKGLRSINVTGDMRIIYKEIDKSNVLFITIGSHSQLYK